MGYRQKGSRLTACELCAWVITVTAYRGRLWARHRGEHFTSISCFILIASLRWDVLIITGPRIVLSKAQRGHLANTPNYKVSIEQLRIKYRDR